MKEKIRLIKYNRLSEYDKWAILLIDNIKEVKYKKYTDSTYFLLGDTILFEKNKLNKILYISSHSFYKEFDKKFGFTSTRKYKSFLDITNRYFNTECYGVSECINRWENMNKKTLYEKIKKFFIII